MYTDFEGVDSVIAELLNNKDIKKAVTRSNLYKFWKSIVGEKFGEKSKPYSMIGGGVMVIACANNREVAWSQVYSYYKRGCS